MANCLALKQKIKASGHSIKQVAAYLNIDRSTFYRKLSGGSIITIDEAQKISAFLNLSKDEVHSIFFEDIVA